MSFEIVEVDSNEMRRASLINRAKNDNVRAIYQALFDIQTGKAMAIIADPGEDLGKIRTTLQHCANRSGRDLHIVLDRMASRVLFTLAEVKPESPDSSPKIKSTRSAQDATEATARRDAIRDAALELGNTRPTVSAQEVVDLLVARGMVMNMTRPATAVSAVMRNMVEFERIGQSQFRHVGA